jgi:hypothetical protein
MNITEQQVNEAVRAALAGIPTDVRTGVCNAVQILRSVDASTLPADLQDELAYILQHSLHSDEDIGEVAERIAYLASAMDVADDETTTAST